MKSKTLNVLIWKLKEMLKKINMKSLNSPQVGKQSIVPFSTKTKIQSRE